MKLVSNRIFEENPSLSNFKILCVQFRSFLNNKELIVQFMSSR